jgi:hypothetical protein
VLLKPASLEQIRVLFDFAHYDDQIFIFYDKRMELAECFFTHHYLQG